LVWWINGVIDRWSNGKCRAIRNSNEPISILQYSITHLIQHSSIRKNSRGEGNWTQKGLFSISRDSRFMMDRESGRRCFSRAAHCDASGVTIPREDMPILKFNIFQSDVSAVVSVSIVVLIRRIR